MAQEQALPSKIPLLVWMSASPDDQQFITGLINNFNEHNPTIEVTLKFIPGQIYLDQLRKAVDSASPPDVASLPYNFVLELQARGALVALPSGDVFLWNDFLKDAYQSNQFNDNYYALPWQRYNCSSSYLNLAVFRKKVEQDTDRLQAAYALLAYLTAPSQQILGYKTRKWYPTILSLYADLGLTCPQTGNIVRIKDPQALAVVIEQVSQRAKPLQCKYEFMINSATPAALLKSKQMPVGKGQTNLTASPADDPPDDPLVSAAPSLNQLTEDEFNFQIQQGIPVKFGALFVNQSTEDFALSPDDYALTYFEDPPGMSKCQALPVEGGTVIDMDVYDLDLDAPVGEPVVQLVEGSFKVCFWFCGKKICIGKK